jgi:type II secretory pathway component PulF
MFAVIATLLLFAYVILGLKKPVIALLTAPVVCFALGYAAVLAGAFEYVLYAVVIFMAMLVAVLLSGYKMDSPRWPQKVARAILFVTLSLGLTVFGISFFLAFHTLGFVFLILCLGGVGLVVIALSWASASRRANEMYVISTLGAAMRQNLPLPMALESATAGQKGKRTRILRKIQKWIVQGYSLSDAIKRGYRRCPGYAAAMIAAGERLGQLPQAFKAIEADMIAKADERRRLRPVHPLYPVIVMSFLLFQVSALMKFVIPSFASVLQETVEGAKLPAPTRFLLNLLGSIMYGHGGVFWLILPFVVVVSMIVWIWTTIRPRRPAKPYLLSRIGDFIKWHLPILHWFERNYSMVQVVEVLRLSLNAGYTVNDSIRSTLSLDVNNRFRRLLKRWLKNVEQGDNIAEAAKESGLGNTLAWAFDNKVNQGNIIPIMEMLESFYRSNYSYRVNLARFILWPCGIVAMGATVGFVVYAIFSPGVAIIKYLAENVYP